MRVLLGGSLSSDSVHWLCYPHNPEQQDATGRQARGPNATFTTRSTKKKTLPCPVIHTEEAAADILKPKNQLKQRKNEEAEDPISILDDAEIIMNH